MLKPKWIVNLAANYPIFWVGAKTAFLTSPPAFLGYAAVSWPGVLLPGQGQIRDALLLGQGPLIFACLAIPGILNPIFLQIDKEATRLKDPDLFSKVMSSSLVSGLNNIVGTKLERFVNFANTMPDGEQKAVVFEKITQPDAQITEIINGLYFFLREVMDDKSLRIVLVRMENKLPVKIVAKVPHGTFIPPSMLSVDAEKTMFHNCAKKKQTISITDIDKHIKETSSAKKLSKRLYHPSGNSDSDSGSIVCFPVQCERTGNVEYVISIKSERPNSIDEKFSSVYKLPINSFSQRILVEHTLKSIKEKTA
jgi:hypothetical protein